MDILILDRNNQILDQFSNKFFSELKYEELLNGVGKGSFEMSIEVTNQKINLLKTNNRVIFKEGTNVYFGGYIYGFRPSYEGQNTILFQNLLGLFNDKRIYDDVTYTSQTIADILTDVLNVVNAREAIALVLNCPITDVVTKQYKKGQTVLSVIDDLLGNKYEYLLMPTVIGSTAGFTFNVNNTIGIDRTTIGNDYIEYKYELNVGSKRTIDAIEGNIDIRNTGNAIIGTDGTNFATEQDNTSITNIGRIERFFKTVGDVASETVAFLAGKKDVINDITVKPVAGNYFEVNLGDIVKIITSGNKLMEFNQGIKVIKKSYKSGDLPTIEISLNNAIIKKINVVNEINTLKAKFESLITNPIISGAPGGGGTWGSIIGTLSDQTDLQNALNAKENALGYTAEDAANKGVANGYAPLGADGKIANSYIPNIAISEFLGQVASEAAMLALTGQRGDWATRSDNNKTYMLIADDASLIGSWKDFLTPSGGVTSVNGQSGVVSLGAVNITYNNADSNLIATNVKTALDELDAKTGTPLPVYSFLNTSTDRIIDGNSFTVAELLNVLATLVNDISGGLVGPAGLGVPAGGAAGEVLAKIDATNNNTEWLDISDLVPSDPTGVTGADQVTNMMSLTQAEYDAIATPDASTFYIITD